MDFSAAVASECLELQRTGEQNIFIGVGSASLSFLLTFMHQLHFAAASRPSFVLTASSQQRRSRTGRPDDALLACMSIEYNCPLQL